MAHYRRQKDYKFIITGLLHRVSEPCVNVAHEAFPWRISAPAAGSAASGPKPVFG